SAGGVLSAVSFHVDRGQTYFLRAAGAGGTTGSYALRLSGFFFDDPTRPPLASDFPVPDSNRPQLKRAVVPKGPLAVLPVAADGGAPDPAPAGATAVPSGGQLTPLGTGGAASLVLAVTLLVGPDPVAAPPAPAGEGLVAVAGVTGPTPGRGTSARFE